MIRTLTLRDIIRLYHTEPIPAKMMERPEYWNELFEDLATEEDIEEIQNILEEIVKNNEWIKARILPRWFMSKYRIKDTDLEYKERGEEPLIIPFDKLSAKGKELMKGSNGWVNNGCVFSVDQEREVIVAESEV